MSREQSCGRCACRRLVTVVTVLLLVPSLLDSQEPNRVPVFPSRVQLVTVDAVVVDKTGRPVAGLTREDFAITEDGKPQEIASFEAFDFPDRAGEAPPPTPIVATNVRPPRAGGRAFVLLVDDLGLSVQNLPPLVKAIARLVDEAFADGDEVTLATTSGSTWWSVRFPDGREDLLALVERLRARKLPEAPSEYLSDWEAYQISNYGGAGGGSAGTSRPAGIGGPEVVVAGGDAGGRIVRRWTESRACAPEAPGLCAQMVRMRAQEQDSRRRNRTRAVIAGVEQAVFGFTGVRGRKELLLFSEGFLEDRELPSVRQVAGICREANVVVNFVDARGLIGALEEGTAAFAGRPPAPQEIGLIELERTRFESEGSTGLAEDTGGLAITSSNDLAGGARRIVDAARVYYLLGYYPPEGKGPRDWRQVKVAVKHPDMRVRARKGYTLRPEGTAEASLVAKPGKDKPGNEKNAQALPADVSRALLNAHDAEGIPLRAMAYVFDQQKPGLARVLVAIEADAQTFDFGTSQDQRQATLRFVMAAVNRDSGAACRSDQTIAISLAVPPSPKWPLLTRELELPPGVTQVRVVARDEKSGRVGAVTLRFEVPPLDGLRLSTPILADEARPAPQEGGRLLPVIAARRTFKAAGRLYCQFQVFGASRSPRDGAPKVEASYTLRGADGTEIRRSAPSLIAVAPDQPVMRLIGLGVDGLPAGDYELVLHVVDQTSGRRVERAERFRLEPSAPGLGLPPRS
jgi:VWFA-related protein